MPFLVLTQRFGYTSVLPRKRSMNRATFSAEVDGEGVVGTLVCWAAPRPHRPRKHLQRSGAGPLGISDPAHHTWVSGLD